MSRLARLALFPFVVVLWIDEHAIKPLRRRIVRWRVMNAIPAGESYAAIRHQVQRVNGRILEMNEAKLIQEVRDFIAAHDASVAAFNAKAAAETALETEVNVNAAERDELAASHALEEAELTGSVNAAIDTLNTAESALADQKSYLVGLLDGIEGTDPTPNEPPVVMS